MTKEQLNEYAKDIRVDNLAGTECVFARIKGDTLFIEEWMRHKTGANELIAKHPELDVRYIQSLHHLD